MPERWSFHMNGSSVLLILAVLLLPALLYFPNAAVLGARAIEEAEGKLGSPATRTGNPLMIFSDGYFVFLTLFAIVAWIASASGLWPAFDYVFNGRWSKGVNLFSLWAALFVLSVTLCVELLIRTALNRVESRLSLKSKTITRLAKSLVTYAVGIFLAFCILDMFGANTTALLASAGIISIAVGMGTQSFASDLLSGFFMMMEGNVHVGDHVSVAGITGHITDIGIRSTEITDEEGNVMILNNSQVSGVLNMSRKHERQEPEDAPENES
jgi:small conductance mechanosensitive channel